MVRQIAFIVIGMFVFAALATTTGCKTTGDRVEQRSERTGSQVEQRTDREIDRAVDRQLDRLFQ